MNRNWTPGSETRSDGRKRRTTSRLTSSVPWDDDEDDDDFGLEIDLDKELAKIKNEDVHQPVQQHASPGGQATSKVATEAVGEAPEVSEDIGVSPKPFQGSEGQLRSMSRFPDGPVVPGREVSAISEVDKMLQDDFALGSSAPLKSTKSSGSKRDGSGGSGNGLSDSIHIPSDTGEAMQEEESIEMKSSNADSDFFNNDSESFDDLLKDSFDDDAKLGLTMNEKPDVLQKETKVSLRETSGTKSAKTAATKGTNKDHAYSPSPRQVTKKRVFKFPAKNTARRPLSDPFAKIESESDASTYDSRGGAQAEVQETTAAKSLDSKRFETTLTLRPAQNDVQRTSTLTDQIARLTGENEKLKESNQESQGKLIALESVQDILQADLDKVKLQFVQSEESVREQSRRIDKLESEKRLLEERLASSLKELDRANSSRETLQKEYAEKHAGLLKERESLSSLKSLSDGVDKSARLLTEFSVKFKEKFESSEHARSVQLEAREKLVAEMERGARDHRDRALQEASRLQAIVDSLEASNRLVHVRHEEERCRLREEHNRLDALKLTLTTEAEIIRNDVAEERIRLRDEKEYWEPYKREQESKIARELEEVRSLWRRYYKEQAELELERKNHSQEKESFAARVQEEELRLVRAREQIHFARRAAEGAARTLDLEKHQLSDRMSSFEGERETIEKERQKLEQSAKALKRREEEVEQKLAQINTEKIASEAALRETAALKAEIASERDSLDAKLHEVALGQRRYRELRLSVVQQHQVLHAEKAAVSKLASVSRRLQTTLLQHMACPQECTPNDKASVSQAMVDRALKSIPLIAKASKKTGRSPTCKLNENHSHNARTWGLDLKDQHKKGGRRDIAQTLRQIDQDFDAFTSI